MLRVKIPADLTIAYTVACSLEMNLVASSKTISFDYDTKEVNVDKKEKIIYSNFNLTVDKIDQLFQKMSPFNNLQQQFNKYLQVVSNESVKVKKD